MGEGRVMYVTVNPLPIFELTLRKVPEGVSFSLNNLGNRPQTRKEVCAAGTRAKSNYRNAAPLLLLCSTRAVCSFFLQAL